LVFFTGNLASSLVAHAVYNSLIFLHAAKHVKTR
jgi:hypothetical protein